MKKKLYGMTLSQLQGEVKALSMPKFTAKQIAEWLYKKRITEIGQMSNISVTNRQKINDLYEIGLHLPIHESTSSDGTKKFLFNTSNEKFIESAYIPDNNRATLCVSSQTGCKMGCKFCMTAKQGFQHNLTANEILNQVRSIPNSENLTNIVYMGMGEPLDNLQEVLNSLEVLTAEWGFAWSPSRITLSTIGVLPALKEFLDKTKVHLAVSLHNPFPEERAEIVPAERAFPIKSVIALLKEYDFSHQRRVSFEYIMLSGMNEAPRYIKELCRLLDGLKCRVNLIRFHKIPDSPFFSPNSFVMERFRDTLSDRGIVTTIRASRGEDIKAACGLLSTIEQKDKSKKQPI